MKKPLYVLYDGNCGFCRRAVAVLTTLDISHRLTLVNARDRAEIEKNSLGWLEENALIKDMHAVMDKKIWQGYGAYRKIARHLPLLWMLWPFLWIWPIPWLGRRIYRHVADSRSCELPPGR